MKSYEFSLFTAGALLGLGIKALVEGKYTLCVVLLFLGGFNLFLWHFVKSETKIKEKTYSLEKVLFGKYFTMKEKDDDGDQILLNGHEVYEKFPKSIGVLFRLFNRLNDQQKEIDALRTVHEEELKRLGDLCGSFASDKDKRMNKFDARLANLKNEIKADMRNEEIQAKAKKVVEKKEVKKVVKE